MEPGLSPRSPRTAAWEPTTPLGPARSPRTGRHDCPRCGARFSGEARFCPLDGSRLTGELVDPLVGQLLWGEVRIEARLGEGGMGVVYRGRQLGLDRPVAVKLLHPLLVTDVEARRRFEREARLCAQVEHAHVVRALFSGHLPDGSPFFVMELLDGPTLEQTLARGPIALSRACRLLAQVCDAAGAAHARGIVHRDLKPENIVLTEVTEGPEGEVAKVLDFGVARAHGADGGDATQSGVVFGTARYISPEGALGEHTDARSDVYSLGVLAYRMFSGRLPFEGPSSVAVLLKHAHEAAPPLHLLPEARHVPRALAEVVMRALEKRPADRYADARALGEALRSSAGRLDPEPRGIG